MSRSIYIAGPMRGIKLYNFPAFDAAKETLWEAGWEVISPADIDRQSDGFDPLALPEGYDWDTFPGSIEFAECVTRDIQAVQSCDALYMLKGWEKSKGARAEFAVAEWLGKEIVYE